VVSPSLRAALGVSALPLKQRLVPDGDVGATRAAPAATVATVVRGAADRRPLRGDEGRSEAAALRARGAEAGAAL